MIILLLILNLTTLAGCSQKDEPAAPVLLEPVTIKLDTETVSRETIYDIELQDGSVVPYTQALYFGQDSQVGKVLVGVGDAVKKGQILISLDRTAVSEELTALQEDIAYTEQNNAYINEQLKCDIEIAKLQLSQLRKNGTADEIALKELDLQKLYENYSYTMDLQEIELEPKYTRLEALKDKISQPDLIAPFDGTVVYCAKLYEGSTARGFDPVIYLADETRLTVQTAYFSADTLAKYHHYYVLIGDKQYDMTYAPYTSEEYKYRVYNKLPLKSNFIVEAADASIKSGMYAAVCFVWHYAEDVLAVPKKALYNDGGSYYVYQVVNGERVRRDVEIGVSTRLKVEITQGLREGDEIYVQQ